MKLIVAIIQDDDAGDVIGHLNDDGFQVTRLSTKGGFLRSGNTTILTGVEDEKIEDVLHVLETNCKSRNQFTTLPAPYGSVHGFMPKPIEVRVGGATVFVIDVEQFHKF